MVVMALQDSVIIRGGAWILEVATIAVGAVVILTFQYSIAVVVTNKKYQLSSWREKWIHTWRYADRSC